MKNETLRVANVLLKMIPSRFESQYAHLVPSNAHGKTFTENFGDHNDPVTKINLDITYNIKAPTVHPIYENFRVKVRRKS